MEDGERSIALTPDLAIQLSPHRAEWTREIGRQRRNGPVFPVGCRDRCRLAALLDIEAATADACTM
eukprot:m.107483 g.107483  ORF g.107483 m.107483 type:complete len:66 (-) comp15189_c0_seq1:1397-1594(-)